MAISHIFKMGGAMSNPFEYREIMKAHFQLNSTKTVDEVLAEQEQRHNDRRTAARNPRSRATPGAARAPTGGAIPRGELAKLQAMLTKAKPADGSASG